MHLYTIEKTAMKAVKSILSMSEKTCSGARMWTRFAYLYEKGLICTDGVRLLRIHDTDLEKEFESFIRETGRVVVFSLQGDSLKMEYDIAKNDTEVGTMEKLIPTDERLNGKESGVFYNRFTEDGKTPKAKDIAKSMFNTAVLSTKKWFDPERFDNMGIRPWARVLPVRSMVVFGADNGEVFICMGLRWEDFA